MMRRSIVAALTFTLCAGPALAQQDTTRLPTGVELSTRYSVRQQVGLAVRPFDGPPALAAVTTQIRDIVQRDLDFSDRFNMVPTPERLASGPVAYDLWLSLGAVWLVSAQLGLVPDGYRVDVTLHDVAYGRAREQRAFTIPITTAPSFRMSVHAMSDEIVRWVTGTPGAAATQIVFTRQNPGGSSDLLIVNADGENLRRIVGAPGTIYSPAFSPDGRRLLYTVMTDVPDYQLIERDLTTGASRELHRAGLIYPATYSPDGSRIVFSVLMNNSTVLHEYDAARRCCVRALTQAVRGRDELAPSFSPNGDRIAFLSNRLGSAHIFVMPASGGGATALSPFVQGEGAEFHAPDWSPTGSQVVFHGRSRGKYQIMLGDASRPGSAVQQLTTGGQNEDPSFAPDGRHVVFTAREGLGGGAPGLYVIDIVTGRTRLLLSGNRLRMADWSPALLRGQDLTAGR
jgi:TolB protein